MVGKIHYLLSMFSEKFCVVRGGKQCLASSSLIFSIFWQSFLIVDYEDHLIYKILNEKL